MTGETFIQTWDSESVLGGRGQTARRQSQQTCSRRIAEEVINRLLFFYSAMARLSGGSELFACRGNDLRRRAFCFA